MPMPDRFVASLDVDPNDITGAVRRIRRARDEVWPKFLRENAMWVFKLDEARPSAGATNGVTA